MRIRRFNESKETINVEDIFQSIIDLVDDRKDLFEVEIKGGKFGLRITKPSFRDLNKAAADYLVIGEVVKDLDRVAKNLDLDGIKYTKYFSEYWIYIKIDNIEERFDSIFYIYNDRCIVNKDNLKHYFKKYNIEDTEFENQNTLTIYLRRVITILEEGEIESDLESSIISDKCNMMINFENVYDDYTIIMIKIENYTYDT